MMKDRVLIVGASNKAARSVAKSLCKQSCDIYILNDADLAVSKSRYVKEYILKPEMSKTVSVFKDELLATIRDYHIKVVLPITDIAIDVISLFRSELEEHVHLLGLNPPEVYQYAHNKHALSLAAREFGIVSPEYRYVESLADLEKIGDVVFPVVIKPVSSARIVNQFYYTYKVSFPDNRHELMDVLREQILSTPVMIQEKLSGYGIGYNVYCIDGEVKSEFIHQRINENSGVSSYRKIIDIHSFGLREKIHALLKHIKWNGVGMLEFIITADGKPFLMEMNGRFFGSTELGVKAGFDFPRLILDDQYRKIPVGIVNSHKKVSLRFLHDEIFLKSHDLFKTKNIASFFGWLFSLGKNILPGNYIEDNLFEDPHFVVNLYKYDLKRFFDKRRKRRQMSQETIEILSKSDIENSHTIAFVCAGNICRSPFAAIYGRQLLMQKAIVSLGTLNLRNRLSPLNAVEASEKFGVSLYEHVSKSLSDIDVSEIDLFIVMDRLNYIELLKRKISRKHIRMLAPDEIKDPYGKDVDTFIKVYTEITTQLNKILL